MAMTAETTVVEEAEAVAQETPNKRGEQLAFDWLDAKEKFVAASGRLQDTREDAREFMVLHGYEEHGVRGSGVQVPRPRDHLDQQGSDEGGRGVG